MKRKTPQPVHEVYNDGFLQYGYKTTQRNENRKRIGESFSLEGKLAFKIMSAREEDYRMAGIAGYSLDLKVKTRFPPSFRRVKKTNLKAVIDNIEYDVIEADRGKYNLYFYLQEAGVAGE